MTFDAPTHNDVDTYVVVADAIMVMLPFIFAELRDIVGCLVDVDVVVVANTVYDVECVVAVADYIGTF